MMHGADTCVSARCFFCLASCNEEAVASQRERMSASPNAPVTAVVSNVFLIHSPSLTVHRDASLALIEARLPALSQKGAVERVTQDEAAELVGRVPVLVDVDASHVDREEFRPLVRNMHIRQVSNAMKHMSALRRAAAAADEPHQFRFSLVIEDDALFGDNVCAALRAAATHAPADADVVFLGLPSTKAPPKDEGSAIYDDVFALFNVLPACDSYLVTPAGAKALLSHMLPVRFPTNVQLTYALRCTSLKAYVSVPNVFVDGSKLGVYTCSLEANNKLIWNQHFCHLDALVKNDAAYADASGGAAVDAEFERIWAAQPFKEHPDVLVLKATHLAKSRRFREAEATYAAALAQYDKAGAVVNNTSDFLRAYISLHRDLQ